MRLLIALTASTLLFFSSTSSFTHAWLLSAQLISRHGTRAPNPVVVLLCPNDQHNLMRYEHMDISPAGLTANGMHELYALGQATRNRYSITYPGFLSPHFDNQELFVQAVAEDRTLQSASAWAQAIFPAGSTPGYNSFPVPVPVYSIPNGKDNLLEARKGECKERLKKEVKQWDETKGQPLWGENSELLQHLAQLCGKLPLKQSIEGTGDNYGDAIKDITDALMFDYQEHFVPLNGLTLDEFQKFRSVAIKQLLGRILGTPEQRTYMNGELPDRLINNFHDAVKGGLRMQAYHGHREMLYAAAAFFGIEYNITFPGLPYGAIPPATTLFVELHQADYNQQQQQQLQAERLTDAAAEFQSTLQRVGYALKKTEDIAGNTVNVDMTNLEETTSQRLFVRISLWVPCYDGFKISDGAYTLGQLRNGAECAFAPLPLPVCDGKTDCPLTEFVKAVSHQITSTGDWNTLCTEKATTHTDVDASSAAAAPASASSPVGAATLADTTVARTVLYTPSSTSSSSSSSSSTLFVLVCVAAAAAAAVYAYRIKSRQSLYSNIYDRGVHLDSDVESSSTQRFL